MTLGITSCQTTTPQPRAVEYVTVIKTLDVCARPPKGKLKSFITSQHVGSKSNQAVQTYNDQIKSVYIQGLTGTIDCYESQIKQE